MIYEDARTDYKDIINSEGIPCTFTAPGSDDSFVISGLFASHHNSVNTDGVPINAKTTRLTIIESDLTDKGYTTRNASGRVALKDHLVDFIDSTGTLKHFIVKESFPSQTFGIITLILGDYGS